MQLNKNGQIMMDQDLVGYDKPHHFCHVIAKSVFFCLNNYCNGIYHKQDPTTNVYEVDGRKRKVIGCTNEPVNCFQGVSRYCKMCYRIATGKSAAEKKQKCNYSKFGCPKCREHICRKCWDKGYDMHTK